MSHVSEWTQAHDALLAKVKPLFDQLRDAAQRAGFVSAMIPPRGPRPLATGAGLSVNDFMSNGDFNRYVQLPYDPVTGTFGGEPLGPNAIPVADLNALIEQAYAFGVQKDPPPTHGKHGKHG